MIRGDVYLANLDPTLGSVQAGTRPVLIFQSNKLNQFTRTVVVIPFTTNLGRAQLPGCVLVPRGEGGLAEDSVALCYQIRVLDKARLIQHLGTLSYADINKIEEAVKVTLDIG
jgi:mRNA interferase MazF